MNLEKILISFLLKEGPLPSHAVIHMLSIRMKSTPNNIRVLLHRFFKSNTSIHVSAITIKHNEHFFYLDGQTEKLAQLLINKYLWLPIGRLLRELRKSHFLFSLEVFKILGQPLESSEGHKSVESYLNELTKDKLIEVKNEDEPEEYICFSQKLNGYFGINTAAKELETRRQFLTFQEAIISDFLERWKKMNILSWNHTQQQHISRGPENVFKINGCYVDAFGFCYVLSVAKEVKGEKKPVPVIINAQIYRGVTKQDIEGFLNTLKLIKYKYKSNAIPVFIYGKPLPKEVFQYAKKNGLVLASAKMLLGNQLETTLNLISDINETKSNNLQYQLTQQIGLTNNIKAFLFNCSMAMLLRDMGYSNVSMNRTYPLNSNVNRECDIIVKDENTSTLIVFELKAYTTSKIKLGKDQDEKDSVKKFFESTLQAVKKSEEPNFQRIVPVFISLSGFEEAAINYMDQQKKYLRFMADLQITFPRKSHYDKNELLQNVSSTPQQVWFKRMVREYFKN